MKKGVLFFILISLIFSCKEEVVKKPENLIEKDIMADVMYDLALLEAIKYQSPNALQAHKINPDEYIYKKYKIDSAQFVQSNMYYASDYKEYKKMYDQINSRLKENKSLTEAAIKSENDKAQLLKKKSKK
jgi:transcriptional regulator with PAS, ATPase and Fis domain